MKKVLPLHENREEEKNSQTRHNAVAVFFSHEVWCKLHILTSVLEERTPLLYEMEGVMALSPSFSLDLVGNTSDKEGLQKTEN